MMLKALLSPLLKALFTGPALRVAALVWMVPAAIAAGSAAGAEFLPVLARVGPWPTLSSPIAFDGRIWFANSVKGRNHNSADVYSYDPRSGQVRYERHLFSQDAGQPTVANGLLYWPFEDSRFSLGWGHYAVTDGEAWRFGTIPGARAFHTHSMTFDGRRLVAATSAWRAGLQASGDGGETWQEIYDHPTADRRVSRIVELISLAGTTFGYLIDRSTQPPRHSLLRLRDDRVQPTPQWPETAPLLGLAAQGGWLYGAVREAEGTAIWRSDGESSRRIHGPMPGWQVRGLAADSSGLWAVTDKDSGGEVWFSADGAAWEPRFELEAGRPAALLVESGQVFVAGSGSDGEGVLWGPRGPTQGLPQTARGRLSPHQAAEQDWAALGEQLDRLLADPESFRSHGGRLRDALYEAAMNRPSAAWMNARLQSAMPQDRLDLIGGTVQSSAAELGRWTVLWAMALAGEGRVPLGLIRQDWNSPANPSEKYFAAVPVAAWAAAWTGQSDPETLSALVARLSNDGDPLWLKGDVVGALSALTGQRFAYDFAAWQRWWRAGATQGQ